MTEQGSQTDIQPKELAAKKQNYWLYLLSNKTPNGPLYLGDTNCLQSRMHEHLDGLRRDYAHYHKLERLVYFEHWDCEEKFKARLRRVRNWPRDMRLLLIQSLNPDWNDLCPEVLEQDPNLVKVA